MVFYSAPLNRGKSGAARIGGGERSEPIRHLQRRRRCRPLSVSDAQRTHFEGAERRTKCSESFPLWGHNLPPSGGHNPRGEAPSTFPSEPFEPSEPSEPFEPYEPSHRRCVQGRHHHNNLSIQPAASAAPLRPEGPSTFPFTTLLHNLRRSRAPLRPKGAGPGPRSGPIMKGTIHVYCN